MHQACRLLGRVESILLHSVLMQHPQTSASTDPRAEGALSLPEHGAGGGFSADSTVAGPYLTGIVTSGSYVAPSPSAIAVATQNLQAAATVIAVGTANLRNDQVKLTTDSFAIQSAGSSQTAARSHPPTASRPDYLRRGADRCVLMLPPHGRPDPALLASLERRNVEMLICFDPHDVVARLCLMARQVQTAERKGLLPLPGGIALIVCEPAKIAELGSVVHTVRRYAARCVCWQFAAATPGVAASLRPLSDDEIIRAGEALAPVLGAIVDPPTTLLTARARLFARGQAGEAESFKGEASGLRLANWAISQADNPPDGQLDTKKESVPTKKPPLTSQELAMLLAEIPIIPSAAATSQRAKEIGVIGLGHGQHRDGETPQ